jgi:magnesium-transporting ATPase (P-type)
VYLKGTIEQVLKMSKKFLYHGTPTPLTDNKIREFMMDANQMAAKGLRGMNIIFVKSI